MCKAQPNQYYLIQLASLQVPNRSLSLLTYVCAYIYTSEYGYSSSITLTPPPFGIFDLSCSVRTGSQRTFRSKRHVEVYSIHIYSILCPVPVSLKSPIVATPSWYLKCNAKKTINFGLGKKTVFICVMSGTKVSPPSSRRACRLVSHQMNHQTSATQQH